jgi:hypothetical protein
MTRDYPELYAYWGSRREDAAACAQRLRRMLIELPTIHPVFASVWHQSGTEAEIPLFNSEPPELAEVRKVVEAGVSIADGVDEPRPEWGYNVFAWCGVRGGCSVSLTMSAGCGTVSGLRRYMNTVHLTPFVKEASDAVLQSFECTRAMLRIIAAAWEPDYASVYFGDYWDHLKTSPGHWPEVRSGWMTYLSADYARRIVAPAAARVELAPGGMVLLATKERFSMDNPAHVAAADAIQAALAPLSVRQWPPVAR